MPFYRFLAVALSLSLFAWAGTAPAAVVFPNGSAWSFVLGTNEASSPATAWRAAGFDDTAWTSGGMPIGYGEPEIVTPVPTSTVGGYTTIYFRKAFNIADAPAIGQLDLTLQVDDGVIVWLNGVEIGRTNSPVGQVAFNATATAAPSQFYPYLITLNASSAPTLASLLQSGNNVLAVHLLNGTLGSSDIFLDAALNSTAPDTAPPVIASLNPPAASTVSDLTQISVTFSESIAGVDAADLLVNGIPATGLAGAGAAYTFSFPQPPGGAVNITWAAAHGIHDLAVPSNAFDRSAPGHTWTYTLSDIFPPTVVAVAPPISSTVTTFTHLDVTFSEAVSGVNAADLTINGSPATNLVVFSPSHYAFDFPQPPAGSVSVVWAGGHGIHDLATVPNAFAGGSWSFTLDPAAASPNLLISEFMASNTRTLADEDNEFSDWIEIHNHGPLSIDLVGWSLTDDAANLTKWTFPATNLNAGGYLVVFASGKDRRIPGSRLHTNFRLGASGEYLALVAPGGTHIVSQYAPAFPAQVADVSYGLGQTLAETIVVQTNAPARVLVPSGDGLALTWTEPLFADGAWLAGTNGAGFEAVPGEPGETTYGSLITTDIRTAMHNQNSSAYIRLPFTLADPTAVSSINLGIRYDDGFVAYLNGAVVASRNATNSVNPVYNSTAAATRSNSLGRVFESIELINAVQWLTAGANVLAIQGLNVHRTNADFLIQATLTVRAPLPLTEAAGRYFTVPTPGAANGSGAADLGPIITSVQHAPARPRDADNITVTARITPAFAPLASNALVYRVHFGAEVSLPMFDDGAHGDGAAGDGIFGGIVPASASTNNQMVRWYITSRDTAARVSRWPTYTDTNNSPQYLGTVIDDPNLTNRLPVLHWFIPTATGADSDAGARVSLYYLGQFYDNIGMNLHGQSTRGFPKKSYDLAFNSGSRFTYRADRAPVSAVNMLTVYADKAAMRSQLAYEAFEALGNPYHWVEPVRVQQNAVFWGTAQLVENAGDDFLKRLGLNPGNPLYKMYNTFTASPTHANLGVQNVEKKTRLAEGSADLQALLSGVLQVGEAQRAFLYDNIDIPQVLNSMATRALVGEQDCCHKNYYFYRDTLGDREWEIWPWDVDLSYGRRWITGPTYWDDQMILNTSMPVGANNGLLLALYNTPEIRAMYWRRQRTLMDEFLQAPGTPTNQLRIERRIDELTLLIASDAALDLAKWGTWCCSSQGPYTQATIPIATNYQTLQQAANLMKFGYLPQRRDYLFTNRVGGVNAEIPGAQPITSRVAIAQFEANPVSGNQAEEYLVLTNINNYAVDISGWKLQGAVDFTFRAGTVIPAGRTLYVSPDVNAFRARTTGPRGGLSLFVVGGYKGNLSARGETIRLVSAAGRLSDSWSYPASPSLAQQYLRIMEIMYHPSPLAGNTNSPEEFEFIELKNTGTTPLSLAGVRLTNGISFNFTGSAVTSLAGGASAVVVKNLAQFNTRHDGSVPPASIAGQYAGSLDNSGERLTLLDAGGEEILDFSYNNSWYPLTDGDGFSLVVVDEHAPPDAWNNKSQWRPSGALDGSPGQDEPAAPALAPVLITEILSRTETPPPTDTVELHNPTANTVYIGGWFLTDDLGTPNKFRIPDNTFITPGGYLTFDESQFNPGGLGFSLSADGDEVYLFSADATGNLTGYFHGTQFGAADNGVSFGRLLTSDGREHFVAQTARTPGGTNAGPVIGPVVITEILYHPPDVFTQTGMMLPALTDDSINEFIEIRNISGASVSLFDTSAPTNTWKLSGGVDFSFPTNVTLTTDQFALLVNFSPTNTAALNAFRAKYGIAVNVQLFGPYSGKLNNDSDDVELKKPTLLGVTNLAYVLVDKVDYADHAPWPAGADGLGYSLQRWNASAFGNEPANWVAAAPTAAATTVTNAAPPRFVSQPAGGSVAAGSTTTLAAIVSGTGPLSYQWLYNGVSLAGATNSALQISSTGIEHDGDYTLFSWNAAGLAVSAPATILVIIPPVIVQGPTNVLVRVLPDSAAAPMTNATFLVAASSRSALTYQWRFNGVNIPGETNSSLTIYNVTTNDLGYATVLVSDGATTLQAGPAWLYPLVRPQILQAPVSQDVLVGGTVTLSALYNGWPPAYTNIWQLGAVGFATNVLNQTAGYISFPAPGIVTTQQYRFVVRNLALPNGVASGFARIVTLTNSLGDGVPDAWRATYFGGAGTTTNSASCAMCDPDGDGMLNWQEYIAGTDPTNALSYLKVDSLSLTHGTRLDFGAISNRTYTIQYSDSPGGSWFKLADVLARTSNRVEIIPDPTGATNRFYRIAVPQQP